MDFQKSVSLADKPSTNTATVNFLNKSHPSSQFREWESTDDHFVAMDVNVDLREVYFLIMHFLSLGPCKKTFRKFWDELQEHELLPRRYHAWYSRSGECSGHENDDGISFPLNYEDLVNRYLHVKQDHLVKLLTQVMLTTSPPLRCIDGMTRPSASDVPTLLGTGLFSLFRGGRHSINRPAKHPPSYLRWPHLQTDHIRGLHLRETGGGFPKHHRAPSTRLASYAVAKPSTMVRKMQYVKRLRGHRAAVYCAIFDQSGRYVITGSDDRLVKIWSMETALCLSSCRGHEGDITDLAVSSNNILVASASNDYSIRVWRLPDGTPVSVLLGHLGAVTAIAFSPKAGYASQLLSSSDDGTCRLWDARSSQCRPRIYLPKPINDVPGNSSGLTSSNVPSLSNTPQGHQILCCAFNASGTVFVTGSSDTYARVWIACRSNSHDPEQPMHEIDLLAGHENDVNYVQFSGCAVAARSRAYDLIAEENIPKFKNSWFSRDNIVTCSRDGSAIIWIPESYRYQGKVGRWTRAYHLKVPPPPMPPQPPRGGPRQRLLPTPRGVNMIVWSLDNRFVLAAIMDCRICVWNANDGGLVHCLNGHTASTYVLDVHPFNPRIAMSAGYDGKTIVWDIWEGIPIWIYEIGRFRLVDGKFSQDGTSIVLSDDVGQIYLLSTGQGESHKDAKYDQFFLGDYRPLNQDTHGNVIDQETQLAPHIRNSQDLLCDSSMLPYPEPYQSMYQRRRLSARGIEWRPSLNFAIGTDIGLGQEYQVFPLVDLDTVIERVPDFVDALYLEPEIDALRDETDSEYFLTDESSSEDEQECAIHGFSSDSENSENRNIQHRLRENLRRSKRKKPLAEVDMDTSARHGKRRHEYESVSYRSKRNKSSRNLRKKSSRRNSEKLMSLRSQRVALRSAPEICELSSYEEEQDGSESDSSETEVPHLSINIRENHVVDHVNNEKHNLPVDERLPLDESNKAVFCPEQIESSVNREKKKLVVKLSMRKSVKSLSSESTRIQPSGLVLKQSFLSGGSGPSSSGINDFESLKDYRGPEVKEDEEFKGNQKTLRGSAGSKSTKGIQGLVKPFTADQTLPGDVMSADSSRGKEGSSSNCESKSLKDYAKCNTTYRNFVCVETGSPGIETLNEDFRDKRHCEAIALQDAQVTENNNLCSSDHKKTGNDSGFLSNQDSGEGLKLCAGNELVGSNARTHELNDIPKAKRPVLKIKTKLNLRNSRCEEGPTSHGGELASDSSIALEHLVPQVPDDGTIKLSDGTSSANNYNHEALAELPDIATDAVRRKRSLRLKATSTEQNFLSNHSKSTNYNFPIRSSTNVEMPLGKASDFFPGRRMEASKTALRFKYSGENGKGYRGGDAGAVTGRRLLGAKQKLNWLLLLEQEEGYRYIPQQGDEIVYMAQGHQEYIESSQSVDKSPLKTFRGRIRAVEVCSVENLEYSFCAGSGESCCKITIKFIDSSSELFGEEFRFTLPELVDFPDFVVERTRYDVGISRNWSSGDKCLVWWRNESGEGGSYWEGQIVSLKDKSSSFPGSPWEQCVISYTSDPNMHLHSPWELHDPGSSVERPQIDFEIREEVLYYLNKLLQSASRDEDYFGISKLEEVSQKENFINRFPVPLSLQLVKARLENNYYRRLESVKHDVMVMLKNACSYFAKDKGHFIKMKRLGEFLDRKLSKF